MYIKMSENNVKLYDRMPEFIEAIFNVFQLIKKKAFQQQNKRLQMIALMIFNYAKKMASVHNVDLKNITEKDSINLIPVFEYVSHNNIELYDFSKIQMSDLDPSKNEDLERFVLTHVYYITQQKS
jgi:hypothetical protein